MRDAEEKKYLIIDTNDKECSHLFNSKKEAEKELAQLEENEEDMDDYDVYAVNKDGSMDCFDIKTTGVKIVEKEEEEDENEDDDWDE